MSSKRCFGVFLQFATFHHKSLNYYTVSHSIHVSLSQGASCLGFLNHGWPKYQGIHQKNKYKIYDPQTKFSWVVCLMVTRTPTTKVFFLLSLFILKSTPVNQLWVERTVGCVFAFSEDHRLAKNIPSIFHFLNSHHTCFILMTFLCTR